MVNTTLTPIFGKRRCICSNVLQSFQDLSDVVTAIRTHGTVKVKKKKKKPAGGNIVARGKSECPKCSGMVSTFITQISTVTVHVLHGELLPVLSADHRLLTCERQLHTCAGLDRAQTPAACLAS